MSNVPNMRKPDPRMTADERVELCHAVYQLAAHFQETNDKGPMVDFWHDFMSRNSVNRMLDALGLISCAAAVAFSDHPELMRWLSGEIDDIDDIGTVG